MDTPSASISVHRWSPIREISIRRLHVEHLIVGKKDDCRAGIGMLSGSGSGPRPVYLDSSWVTPAWAFGVRGVRRNGFRRLLG